MTKLKTLPPATPRRTGQAGAAGLTRPGWRRAGSVSAKKWS